MSEPIRLHSLPRVANPHDRPPADGLSALEIDARASDSLAWREALGRRMLGAADVLATAAALLLVLARSDQRHLALLAMTGVALVLLLFKVGGLYDHDDLRLVHSTLDEVPVLIQLTGLVALCMAVLQGIAPGNTMTADQIVELWIVAFVAVFAGRVLARATAARTSPVERCLVVGEPVRVTRIREKLAASRARAEVVVSLSIAVEAITREDPDEPGPWAMEHVDWLAMTAVFREVVQDWNVHRIVIAPNTTDTADVVNLIRAAKAVGVRVSVLPRMFEVVGSAVEFDDIDGMTMLGVRRFGLSRSSRLLKRAFDVIVAAVVLVLCLPLIGAIVIAIKLESHGPVFFRQIRVGKRGVHFRIFKFRSMVAGAEGQKEQLRVLNEAGQAADGLFKITNDPRITRVGRFLRNTSLDELPQLLNVLRGEMSLVGPRPLVTDEDVQVVGLDRSRLHLTPGMTGPWQVLDARVPMQEMVGIDYLYVANWSLWLDLKVLVRTVRHVASRRNI